MKCEEQRQNTSPNYAHTDFEALDELLDEWKENEDVESKPKVNLLLNFK